MIWDINTGEHISTFQGHKGPVVSLTTCWLKATKPDEDGDPMSELYLASGSVDKNVILWNMNDENDTLALKGHDDCITCIMSLGDGRNLVTGR
jgi:WD40 repeat protein